MTTAIATRPEHADSVDLSDVNELLSRQSGVIRRAQLHAAGLGDNDVERLVRRRELIRMHPRVYATRPGPMSWLERAWGAVLWAHPAALSHGSAVRVADHSRHDTRRDDGPIHVAIAARRRLDPVPGVVVHRVRHLSARALDLDPPRIRLEDALLDLAAEARSDLDAVAVLADACGARRTTPDRLLEHLGSRRRVPRRQRIVAVLADAASGTCSALEQAYLDLVVRPHGLPIGARQASHRHGNDQRYRDVLVEAQALCVELDGRLVHGTAEARDADLERDLDAISEEDLLTVRLSWGQVVDRACRTADRLARLLQRRGWAGTLRPCAACRSAA